MRSFTPTITALAALAFASLALGGCTETADGPDLVGVWQVTAHTHDDAGCGEGTIETDPPYIQFTRESILGQEFFQWAACTSPTACAEPNPLFDPSYGTAITDGWEAKIFTKSGDTAGCILGAVISTAVVGADGSLTVDTRLHSTEVTGTTCTLAEAEAAYDGGRMTCGSRDRMIAIRQ